MEENEHQEPQQQEHKEPKQKVDLEKLYNKYYKLIRGLVDLNEGKGIELDLKYFNHYLFHRPHYHNKTLSDFTQQTIGQNVTHSSPYFMGNEMSYLPFYNIIARKNAKLNHQKFFLLITK